MHKDINCQEMPAWCLASRRMELCEVTAGQRGEEKVGVQEPRVHTARQPPSQMPVTLVSQLSANRGGLRLVTAAISHFHCQIKVINLEAPLIARG